MLVFQLAMMNMMIFLADAQAELEAQTASAGKESAQPQSGGALSEVIKRRSLSLSTTGGGGRGPRGRRRAGRFVGKNVEMDIISICCVESCTGEQLFQPLGSTT